MKNFIFFSFFQILKIEKLNYHNIYYHNVFWCIIYSIMKYCNFAIKVIIYCPSAILDRNHKIFKGQGNHVRSLVDFCVTWPSRSHDLKNVRAVTREIHIPVYKHERVGNSAYIFTMYLNIFTVFGIKNLYYMFTEPVNLQYKFQSQQDPLSSLNLSPRATQYKSY